MFTAALYYATGFCGMDPFNSEIKYSMAAGDPVGKGGHGVQLRTPDLHLPESRKRGPRTMDADPKTTDISTGLRSYDLARFGSQPVVSEILPMRSGTGALVRHAIAGPCALECTSRPDHIVFVVLEPYPLHVRADRTFDGDLSVGSVGIFPADIPVRWEADSGAGAVIHLHVSPTRLTTLVQAEPEFRRCGNLVTSLNRHDPVIASIGQGVRDEIRDGRPGCRLLLDTLFQALCIHVLRRYTEDPATCAARPYAIAPHRLARAREFIDSHLGESIGIDDIAAAAGLSAYHFSRCFKQAVGVPPYHYVRLRRVERARSLLERSDLPLTDVALVCGFASQQHMAEAFRDHLGTTPGRYRREYRSFG